MALNGRNAFLSSGSEIVSWGKTVSSIQNGFLFVQMALILFLHDGNCSNFSTTMEIQGKSVWAATMRSALNIFFSTHQQVNEGLVISAVCFHALVIMIHQNFFFLFAVVRMEIQARSRKSKIKNYWENFVEWAKKSDPSIG